MVRPSLANIFVILNLWCLKSYCAAVSDSTMKRVLQCGVRHWDKDEPTTRTKNTIAKIIGGKVASPKKWPWIVALFAGGKFFCTASLVSSRYVLTAAHCIRQNGTFEIVAGVTDYTSKTSTRLATKRVVVHPDYVEFTLFSRNDIVVIELVRPLNFTQSISPICLAKKLHETDKDKAFISGWGRIKWTKQNATISPEAMTTTLHDANAHLVKYNECKNAQDYPDKVDTKVHICARGDNHTSVFHGDSGGPLMINSTRTHLWTQVGITSGGDEGEKDVNDPRIFTRISTYCQWITKETNGEVNCV